MPKRKIGSAGRYGPRVGKKDREKVNELEKTQLSTNVCPNCGMKKVVRVSKGIWRCTKCEITFAGGSYNPRTETTKEE